MIEGSQAQEVAAAVPDGIRRWNWGAFLIPWIWAIGNNVWIGLLALAAAAGLITETVLSWNGIVLPCEGVLAVLFLLTWLVLAIVLGIKGNAWAWQSRKWRSVESFRRAQRVWAYVGVVVVAATAAGIWYIIQQIGALIAVTATGGG